ncbi:MAG: hypothetical protein AAB677_00385 [Patescibacteria group bacterium]
MLKKYLFLSLLVLSFLVSPLIINAETSNDVASRIAELQRQIAVLQEQLRQLQGQARPFCFTFNKNLGVGNQNDDVTNLYRALVREGFLSQDEFQDGRQWLDFNEGTAAAVSAFQLKYRNEILTPLGLTSPTGYVGPATRAVLNRLYGCRPVTGNRAPIISGVSGPTTLKIGETGTWTVRASDPENGPLSYSARWGDEIDFGGIVAGVPSVPPVQQSATFTHSYNRAGASTPTFTVIDNTGQSARTSLSVVVGQNLNQKITVLTPNDGETLIQKTRRSITWRVNVANFSTVDLYVLPVQNCSSAGGATCLPYIPSPIIIERGVAGNIYDWSVGMFHTTSGWTEGYVQGGYYKIVVCSAGAQPGFYGVNESCDSSDTFTIVSNQPKITVLTPNGGEQWVASSTQAITWVKQAPLLAHASAVVDLYLQAPMPVCPPRMGCVEMMPRPIVLDKNVNAYAPYNWIVATDIVNKAISAGNYYVEVCEAGTRNNCDSSDNYFTIVK